MHSPHIPIYKEHLLYTVGKGEGERVVTLSLTCPTLILVTFAQSFCHSDMGYYITGTWVHALVTETSITTQ